MLLVKGSLASPKCLSCVAKNTWRERAREMYSPKDETQRNNETQALSTDICLHQVAENRWIIIPSDLKRKRHSPGL